ncbi:hypothetical protein IPG41_02290 [Candidatus Peregrinibacteria bacterium]|nr:MAG: hypothetical protein IPG41_02290 [Candidatus Peregrinibacteria bacterium]
MTFQFKGLYSFSFTLSSILLMSEIISTANEGVHAIYTQAGTALPLWLHKLQAASLDDSTGILKIGKGVASVDPEALTAFLTELDRIESTGKTEVLRALTSGGLGVAGEVLAVRRTLADSLQGRGILKADLLSFQTSASGLRFPIGLEHTPNCPTSNQLT